MLKKVRALVPYKMAYTTEKMRPNFKKEFQAEWTKIEQILVLVMLYHSNSLDEAKKFLNNGS
jgi:hypothetical protein